MNTFQRIAATVMLATVAAAMMTCGAQLAHGKTFPAGEPLGNIVGYQENPFIYNVGAVTKATPIDGENLLITFSPLNTYQQYTEKIQFCGSPIFLFNNKKNPVVLTYTRQAYRIIGGRGCHELLRVDSLGAQ